MNQTTQEPLQAIEILLVVEKLDDVELNLAELGRSRLHLNVTIVTNVFEAMAILRGEGEHVEAMVPDLIMLDLNLPDLQGHEVLSQIKLDPFLAAIPTVIITSSKAEEELVRSHKMEADCFVTKPLDLNQISQIVQSVDDLWLAVVKRPARG